MTSLDFGHKRNNSGSRSSLVRSQSGLIIPPRSRKKHKELTVSTLVRAQSGQIVPPRLKKSVSNVSVSPCVARVPPTPPKRKKHLQIEKINQLFMNLVDLNGEEGMQSEQGKS